MFTPRPYQIELVERALMRNTIACLNSTAAKSFIWITYLRETLSLNFDRIRGANEKKIAVVLFDSDLVVDEQGPFIQNHINHSIAVVSTENGSHMTRDQWSGITQDNVVVVTTPKALVSFFERSICKPTIISVLILDECEKVLEEKSDYRTIMRNFEKEEHSPQTLGLTCSLLKESSASQLQEDIHALESFLHCKAETTTDLIALDGHSPSQPDEKIVLCGKTVHEEDERVNKGVDCEKLCKDIKNILLPALRWLEVCGINCATGITHCEVTEDKGEGSGDPPTSVDQLETPEADINPTDSEVEELRAMSFTVLSQVLLVLDVLGPWCAHRLVILLLKQLQKNIPSEKTLEDNTSLIIKWRYFLLRFTDSQLRTIYTLYQSLVGNQKKVDLTLVTPKVNRLLQVLKEYKPPAEPEKKYDGSKVPKYNDRSEVGYVSWWQDSDAEDDDDDNDVLLEGEKENYEGWNSKSSDTKLTKGARQYNHGSALCGIVFVKEKYVAVMLQRLLKEVSRENSDLRHITSAHITSLSTGKFPSDITDVYGPSSTERLKQEEVLRSFRSHEINLLVSTNCLEECVAIPKCNLVVRFDVPENYKSYILSKSRTKSNNSTYMMLVQDKEKPSFLDQFHEFKKIEKVLQNSVLNDKIGSEAGPPKDYDYFDVKDDSDDEVPEVPPYYSGPNTCVTLDSAIHVINRYCSRLPSDPFTHLSPHCEIFEHSVRPMSENFKESSLTYQCALQLPINAHVRNPIRGPQMPTVLLAQKAVALEACKILHNSGELDDNFLPIGKEMVKYAEELDPWPEEKSQVPGRPGTTKRRQTYEKETPVTLSNCLPTPGTPLFLYEIRMKLQHKMPDELNVRRRTLHAPEETTRCFGILTANPLPKILGFPIFTRSGEESVHIHLCKSFITLGEHHLKLIKSFHHYIFSDMLRVDRVPLVFKPGIAPMQILVVILDKSRKSSSIDIDWKFMCQVSSKRMIEDRMKSDPWFRHRHLESKGHKNIFVFKRSKYEDGVVVAKYRSPDQPNRFYVAEIKDELDPYSNFPSAEYESFHHYYRIKYGLDVSCLNQPLLDVDHTSSRLNLLTPRYVNQKGKALPVTSLEKKRAKYETLTNRQILVPELCDLHPIPASLWRKAVCIPSIVYRLSAILVAEELRQKIAVESGIGEKILPFGWKWPDLDFGWGKTEEESKNKGKNVEAFTETLKSVDVAEEREGQKKVVVGKKNGEDVNSNQQCNLFGTKEGEGDVQIKNYSQLDVPSTKTNEDPETFRGSKEREGTALNNEESIGQTEKSAELAGMKGTEKGENHMSSNENVKEKNNVSSSDSDLSSDSDSENYVRYFEHLENGTDSNGQKRSKVIKHDRNKKIQIKGGLGVLGTIPKSVIDKFGSQKDTALVGPSPGLILQALTLSNASDGFNLERLEMLGDSFLKHAVTVYLFCTYPDAHEGKLSYMRSKKVSNYNLYRIGSDKQLPQKMIALIFDPAVNWLPPGYIVGSDSDGAEEEQISKDPGYDDLEDEVEIGVWTGIPGSKNPTKSPEGEKKSVKTPVGTSQREVLNIESAHSQNGEDEEELYEEDEIQMIDNMLGGCLFGNMNGLRGDRRQPSLTSLGSMQFVDRSALLRSRQSAQLLNEDDFVIDTWTPVGADGKPLCATDPLIIDLHTQHSLADKSIADCVEALLGTYLTTCGHRAAQILLCYFGLKVLPKEPKENWPSHIPGYGFLKEPTNVLLDDSERGRKKLALFTKDLESFEKSIGYKFKDKAYLLQAFTHASYYLNNITDCYQRLEFLGDAILDFLITCQLFNDPERQHSPGALTDLRSALVNNTIFASLAVRHNFHKYFKAISPELHHIIDGFVIYQQQQGDPQGMDAQLAKRYYSTSEKQASDLDEILAPDKFMEAEDIEEEEDVEVPKALGDIFESVAGAIYIDSGMNLDEVWRVYKPMMAPLIEKFSACVPRAPVRELLEMEPETAKFSWAEKRCDGKVRVTVEVIGKGSFKGVGRSYRIAKSAAARRALRYLKSEMNEN